MGSFKMQIIIMLGGVLVMVIGLLMSDTLIDQISRAAGSLGKETYSSIVDHDGAQNLNGMLVLLYYAGLMIASFSLMGVGGYSAYRKYQGM